MSSDTQNPNAARALTRAVSAAMPPDLVAPFHAPQSATKTHRATSPTAPAQNEPTR
jgi:hypothetical protein